MKQFKQYLRSLRKRFGELPARPVAALLSANVKPPLTPRWHWTADEYDASYAWGCDFFNGSQGYYHMAKAFATLTGSALDAAIDSARGIKCST